MKIRLNYWQLILLFLPAIIGIQLFHIPYTSAEVYIIAKTTLNLLFNFSPIFVIGYQTYLVINFNKIINGAKWFTVNSVIPLIFIVVNFSYAVGLTILQPRYLPYRMGPIEQADSGFISNITMVLLLHTIVTFFVVNNIYVSRKIKKIPDNRLRDQLSFDFLKPMKKLKNMSFIVLAGMLILAMVIDIFVNGFVPNQD